jgi:hypothetical protein
MSTVLCVTALSLAAREANAQFPGYGWGYDYPVTGLDYGAGGIDYGLSAFGFPPYGTSGYGVGPAFYGASGIDYGLGAFGFAPYGTSGYGVGPAFYGASGIDYGLGAFGFAPYGTSGYGGYNVGPAFGGGGTVNGLSNMGALFGSGSAAVGNQGLANRSNRSGRAQVGSDRRAKARRLQQQRGGGF